VESAGNSGSDRHETGHICSENVQWEWEGFIYRFQKSNNMFLKPYVSHAIILRMVWIVKFHDEFEFDDLSDEIQDELLARLKVLAEFGPQLGRPNVDTLNDSSFPNMKELRFRKDGLWHFAFAFDPLQQAIVLVGGDKEGENQTKFYRNLIKVADARFSAYLRSIQPALKKGK
jgi:hypothetical protein